FVGAAFLHQAHDRVELFLGGEGFFGGDAQVTAVTAGLEFVGQQPLHSFKLSRARLGKGNRPARPGVEEPSLSSPLRRTPAAPAMPPETRSGGNYQPSCTAFVTRQASTPSGPSSLPWPDHLTPPNGLSAPPIMWLLMPTMPASISAARRRWRRKSPVQA